MTDYRLGLSDWALTRRASPWPALRLVLIVALVAFVLGVLVGHSLDTTQRDDMGTARAAKAAQAGPDRLAGATSVADIDLGGGDHAVLAPARIHPEARGQMIVSSLLSINEGQTGKWSATIGGPRPAATDAHDEERDLGTVAVREPAAESAGMATRQIEGIIRNAALRWGVDPDRMVRVAKCESSPELDLYAIGNAQELGLFQWKPTSWKFISRVSGLGYRIDRIFDAEAQSEMAAWAFANGYAGWWSCR